MLSERTKFFFQYLISRDSPMLFSRALSFATFNKKHSALAIFSTMLQFSYFTSRASVRHKREKSEGRSYGLSSRCGAFEIINANSGLSTGKPQIFYTNHTNELSILHLCKIFAIVRREIFNERRTRSFSPERT